MNSHQHVNFERLGELRSGSDNATVFLDLTIADTYLGCLTAISRLNYFKTVLAYSFDPKKYFSRVVR